MKKQQLFVIPYGTDGFEGDSGFYCPEPYFKYDKIVNLDDVRQAWINHTAKGCGKEERAEIEEDAKDIKGAWVVDMKGIRAAGAIWETDPGCDSAVYRCNSASKHVAEEVCLMHVGKKP